MLKKEARKPSTDPVQEKLRQNKALWNKEVSLFINDLINLKKTMNGWPSKFHMEKSSIKEPVPADPSTILGVLSGDFQDLAQKGEELVRQQYDYSIKRRKKQPSQISQPSVPEVAPTTDLSQQLSTKMSSLQIEGSNPITRFFSKLKGPWFGPEIRTKKHRLSLLNLASDLDTDFKRLENQIVGSGPESIFLSSKILNKIEDKIYFMAKSLASYQDTAKPVDKNAPAEKKLPTENEPAKTTESPTKDVVTNKPQDLMDETQIQQAKLALLDFNKHKSNFLELDPSLEKMLNNLTKSFLPADVLTKKDLAPQVLEAYKLLLDNLNKKKNTQASSFEELSLSYKKASENLNKIADNIISKWLKKTKHKLSPFDKTSALRLDIYNLAEENRVLLNKIMNVLESTLEVDELMDLVNLVSKNILAMKELMKPLEVIIRGKMFDEPFMNLLQSKKLVDYDFGLNDKQKGQLQKMIQTRQLRDLTNMYRSK